MSPEPVSGIDAAGAAAAIEAAGGLTSLMQGETGVQPGTATPQGEQGATYNGSVKDPVTGKWVSPGQEVTQQTPAPQEQQDAFTSLDPNSIPPDLQPYYKSMQGDYTRKTQELAAERRLIEELGGQEAITEAARLYQSLQNPAYWPQLYSELAEGMEQLGLTPQEQASQQAAMQQQAPGFQQPQDESFDWSDPEYAPIKQMFDSLASKVDGISQTFEQQRQAEQQERLQMAIVGELQRQEGLIRQMNPAYTQEDLDAIYELSNYYQGNLMDAQKRYEGIVQGSLERFLAQKQQAVGNAGVAPIPGGGTLSQPHERSYGSLDEAHVAAMEHLRQMEASEL